MNYTNYADFYEAEVAYRREQMRQDRDPIFRFWRRTRSRNRTPGTAPANRKG